MGFRVLLVDFDAQASLTYSLGIEDTGATIAEVLSGEKSVMEALVEREGMHVLPSGRALADVELSIAQAEEKYHHLKNLISEIEPYDFILIDCPPSLSLLTLNALIASHGVIVPMQMDVLALAGFDALLNTVESVLPLNPALHVLGILPVMFDSRRNISNEILTYLTTNYSAQPFKQPIRASVKVAEAPSFGITALSYAPNSTTANDYRLVASEVVERAKDISIKKNNS